MMTTGGSEPEGWDAVKTQLSRTTQTTHRFGLADSAPKLEALATVGSSRRKCREGVNERPCVLWVAPDEISGASSRVEF